MFKDLRDAIREVLEDCCDVAMDREILTVTRDKMKQLQSEYNIYFIEPEDEQLEEV
jgi:hypothetical protein